MDNIDLNLRDAAADWLAYNDKAAGVLLPIDTGRAASAPVFVVAGTVADILRLLETLK